jgi:diguanylate cyclase
MSTIFALEPIMSLTPHAISGVEVLCREYDRNGVLKLPENFDEHLMRVDFREFILTEATERTANWMGSGSNASTYVSININPVELQNIAVIEKLLTIIKNSGICKSRFHFEVTEEFTNVDICDLQKGAVLLTGHGIGLYIDDFGSGFQPFTYLMELPVSGIKLDRMMLRKSVLDKRVRSIMQSCYMVSTSFGIDIIAEGVESLGDEIMILSSGIRHVQGHYYEKNITLL